MSNHSDTTKRARVKRPTIPPEDFPSRLKALGFSDQVVNGVEAIIPPICEVPAGPFLMGSLSPRRDPAVEPDELPQHTVTLPTFFIGRFPVTVAEYACFVRAGHPAPPDWYTQERQLDHPVVRVTWNDAMAYATWLSQQTSMDWRLPSEAEWEKAARGIDGRRYPWGDTFDYERCHTREDGMAFTVPVGHTPEGASPYGAQEMAGNVWEWTRSLRWRYPYEEGRDEEGNSGAPWEGRVLRGGSWNVGARSARAAARNVDRPDSVGEDYGFRLIRVTPTT